MNTEDTSDTCSRALDDATRASIAAAVQAFERGEIQQREVAPGSGVWTLGVTK